MKRRHLVFVALLATALAGLAFACGSDDGPDACTGPLCDGGSSESGTTEGGGGSDADAAGGGGDGDAGDGDASADARVDSPDDAGACKLEAPDADAGPSGTLQWALNLGTTGHTTPTAVAVDPLNDDAVVVGSFFGSLDFGAGTLTSQAPPDGSGGDVFVAKRDKTGAHKWARTFGDGVLAQATTVAVTPTHHVVLGGGFFSGATLDFGCGAMTAIGDVDAFLVDLDPLGNCVWSKRFGVMGEVQNVVSAAVDAAGNVVLGGIARGGVTMGGAALNGYFIAKFSGAGAHVWSKAFAASSSSSSPSLTVDPLGKILLAGSFKGTADFGGGSITSTSNRTEAFVAKYDSSGAHEWAKRYPAVPKIAASNAGAAISGHSLAVDACGNVFIAGGFGAQTGGATIDFGAGELTAAGGPNESYRFLAKLDPTGKGVWSKLLVGTSPNHIAEVYVGGLAIDGTGGPVLMTSLAGDVFFGEQTTVNFGGAPLTNVNRSSIAIASFNALGAHRWSHVAGAPSTARSTTGGLSANARVVAIGFPFTRCTSTCATSPPGTTLSLAGASLTATSGQDLAVFTFVP
ncbi:MAG TPA: hypothetical protein PLR99_19385 [Polyangiaceae bacterium]|nr:hypothetical protein [Polyangiaceae bacterium]